MDRKQIKQAEKPNPTKRFYWDKRSNSAELLDHWIKCRGDRFGYNCGVIEHE